MLPRRCCRGGNASAARGGTAEKTSGVKLTQLAADDPGLSAVIVASGVGNVGSRARRKSLHGRQAPHAGRPVGPRQPRRWCQDSLQKPVGSDPAGDDAQFVAKMVTGWLRRAADGRLSTQSRPSRAAPIAGGRITCAAATYPSTEGERRPRDWV
jgi:hypothetical protein